MTLYKNAESIHNQAWLINVLNYYWCLKVFITLGSRLSLFFGLFCNWEVTVIITSLTFLNNPGFRPCCITPSTLTASWEPDCTLINSPNTRGCGEIASFTLVDCITWKKNLGIGKEAFIKSSTIFLRISACWNKIDFLNFCFNK